MGATVTLTPAYCVFTFTGNLSDGDAVKIGNVTYRFKSTIAQANDIHLEATEAATLATFMACINGTGISGTDYYAGTTFYPDLAAVLFSTHVVRIYNKIPGALGNALILSETTDSGNKLVITNFANGVGDVSGASGFVQSMLDNGQFNSDALNDLHKLTYATD